MMTKSKFRSTLSLVLALIMMSGLWVPAWATDEEMIDQPVSVTATGGDISAAVGNQPAAPEQVEVDSSADPVEVTVMEDIHTGADAASALTVTTDSSAAVSVTAQDVIASDPQSNAVEATASGGEISLSVGTVEAGGDGLHAMTAGGGEIKAETGDIQAGGDGVTAGSKEDGGSIEIHTGTIDAGGDGVVAESTESAGSIEIQTGTINAGEDGIETVTGSKDSSVKVTVGSEESPTDVTADGTAVIVQNQAGSTEITVTQNVNGKDGVQINLTDGTVNVAVGGDAAAAETGLEVSEAAKDFPVTGEATVEIAGTLHVDEGGTPVLLGSGITPENVEITVWKVEIGDKQAEAGEIVRQGDASEPQSETAKTVEENINYIIKIDPQQSGSLSSDKGTAKANETVKITVTIPDGHTLKAVYTDEGKTLTAQDNGDGTFTLTVPVGGGVYVHADFEKQTMPMPGSVPVHRVSPPPPVPVPPPARRLDSQQEGTSFIYRPGGTYFTLLANTVSDLMNRRGIKTFIIEMNGKTYTIIAEDLLAWFGGTPSVTMHVDGDKLVLNFERGETVILDSDETLAAKQKEQYENDKRGDLPEATDKSTAAAAAAAAAASAERVVAAARMAAELAAMAAAAEAAGIKTNVPIEPKVARQPDPFIRKPNPPVPVPAPARPSERRPGLPPLLPFQMPSIPDEPEVPEETTDSEELEQNNELDNRKADALMPDGTVEVRAGPAGS